MFALAVAIVGSLGIVVILGTLVVLYNAWALSVLWGWFMVPILHLPALNIPQAIGIALVISLLTHQHDDAQQKDRQGWEVIIPILNPALFPILSVGIGWIIHTHFMGA